MRRCRQTVVDPSLTPPGMEHSFPSIPPLAHAGQPTHQAGAYSVIIKPEAGACLLASPHLHVLATGTHPPCQASFPARTPLPPDSISDSAWQGWCSSTGTVYFPNRPDRRNGNPCLVGTGNTTACGPQLQIARHRRDSSAHYPANRVPSSWVDSSASGSALLLLPSALHVDGLSLTIALDVVTHTCGEWWKA